MLRIHLIFSLIIILPFGCYHNPRSSTDELGINIPKEWSMPIHEKSDNNEDWVTAFKDKELISYLEAVKVKSPDFLSILENEKIGRYNAKIRGANILPSVNIGFNQSESRQNLSAFGFADSFLVIKGPIH